MKTFQKISSSKSIEKLRAILYGDEEVSSVEIIDIWREADYSEEVIVYSLDHLDSKGYSLTDPLVDMLLGEFILNYVFQKLFFNGFWGNKSPRVDTHYLDAGKQAKLFKDVFPGADVSDPFLLIVSFTLTYEWRTLRLRLKAKTSDPRITLQTSLDLKRARSLTSAFLASRNWSQYITKKLKEILKK